MKHHAAVLVAPQRRRPGPAPARAPRPGFFSYRGAKVKLGYVKRIVTGKGYGFIKQRDSEEDVFFHLRALVGIHFDRVRAGWPTKRARSLSRRRATPAAGVNGRVSGVAPERLRAAGANLCVQQALLFRHVPQPWEVLKEPDDPKAKAACRP